MITVEALTPKWESRFLESRNSIFTAVSAGYLDVLKKHERDFPVRTFLCRDEAQVLSWGSFYVRGLELGNRNARPLRIGQACAIGTLPEQQRRGLGRKVWQAAEKSLMAECDGIVIYTDECGDGYQFYRAMGYLPIAFPRRLRLDSHDLPPPLASTPFLVKTCPFPEAVHLSRERDDAFKRCYKGCSGYLAGRPASLDAWAQCSFFYDPAIIGQPPKISWIEDANGRWLGYCLWTSPIVEPAWKQGTVEIWEIAIDDSLDETALHSLLQPALAEVRTGASADWWAVPIHTITSHMLSLGFREQPRSFSVLAKIFSPAPILAELLSTGGLAPDKIESLRGGRTDLTIDDVVVEFERDSVTRLVLGRTTVASEYEQGLVTARPDQRTLSVIRQLNDVLSPSPWAYLASEYI